MVDGQARRIPNLLHLLLFLAVTAFAFVVAEAGVLAVLRPHPLMPALLNVKVQLVVNILTYVLALGVAVALFPVVWRRSFLGGIGWDWGNVRPWLALAGVGLGVLSEAVGSLLPAPAKMPIEDAVRTPGTIWVLVGFGVLAAPLFEEIVFRGFLLPGVAIAVDWLRLPRARDEAGRLESLVALDRWRVGEGFSPVALVVGSVVSSVLFALVHAPQLGRNLAPVGLLAVVSMVLCWVRIRWRSVAASTVVHACYNFAVFGLLFAQTGGFRHLERL